MFISIVKVAERISRYIKTPETVAPNCVTVNWHFTSGLLICKARWSVTETVCKSPRNRLVMAVFCNLCLISLLFTSLQISTADSKISDVVYNLSKESAVREPVSICLAVKKQRKRDNRGSSTRKDMELSDVKTCHATCHIIPNMEKK